MTKTLCAFGVFAAMALPTAANAQDPAPTPEESAQAACKAERTAVGKAAFKATYGTATKKKQNGQNAMRNCIRKTTTVAKAAVTEAKNDCKTEQGTTDESRAAFDAKYGTNKNKRNAYGKCVSAASKAAVQEATEARISASKACKTERGTTDESRAAFAAKYGTNKNKRNAFGKCVSATAKAQQDDEPAPAPTA